MAITLSLFIVRTFNFVILVRADCLENEVLEAPNAGRVTACNKNLICV